MRNQGYGKLLITKELEAYGFVGYSVHASIRYQFVSEECVPV